MRAFVILIVLALFAGACSNNNIKQNTTTQLITNVDVDGMPITINVQSGRSFNHPTFAIWVEDLEGNYIETLFVTKYIATGIFGHGSLGENKWDNKPGPAKRPAALPYWLHKRSAAENVPLMPTENHPVPDAITGATPQSDFAINSVIKHDLPQQFKILLEVNVPWDYNPYWMNEKYPDDFQYRTSAQPALVYAVTIDKKRVKQGVLYEPNWT